MKKCYSTGAITLAAGAMVIGSAFGVSALEVKSGNDKIDLKLYGHINRAVMAVDDGNESKIFHVDNTNSESRIGIKGEVGASDSLTIGGNIEVEWQSNPSHKVSMQEESISSELKERKMEVYFDTENIGKFSIGRGDMVSNGSSEVDLSGTDTAGNSGAADAGGGFVFLNNVPALSGDDAEDRSITVGDIFDQMDGLSRWNRVRYDTPTFGGFSLGLSAGEKEMADAALAYSGKFSDGTKLKAEVAYADPGEGKDYTQVSGSASILFGFGLNFTVAGGTRDLDDMPADGDDPTFMYGKVGYRFDNLVSVGYTAFSCDYGVYENIENQIAEQEGTAYGVQFTQNLSGYGTDLYAAYRNFELEDNTGADYEPISVTSVGARIKF